MAESNIIASSIHSGKEIPSQNLFTSTDDIFTVMTVSRFYFFYRFKRVDELNGKSYTCKLYLIYQIFLRFLVPLYAILRKTKEDEAY